MYICIIIFSINEQDLLTSEEKEEIEKNFKENNSNLNYLIIFMFFSFVSLSAANIIISVNYYSPRTISLLFAVLFFASFSISSVMCSNRFDKRDLKIQWIFSFTLIPTLSVFAVSILAADLFEKIKINQLWLMIFVFVLFFISFLSFYITKKEMPASKKPAT